VQANLAFDLAREGVIRPDFTVDSEELKRMIPERDSSEAK